MLPWTRVPLEVGEAPVTVFKVMTDPLCQQASLAILHEGDLISPPWFLTSLWYPCVCLSSRPSGSALALPSVWRITEPLVRSHSILAELLGC